MRVQNKVLWGLGFETGFCHLVLAGLKFVEFAIFLPLPPKWRFTGVQSLSLVVQVGYETEEESGISSPTLWP